MHKHFYIYFQTGLGTSDITISRIKSELSNLSDDIHSDGYLMFYHYYSTIADGYNDRNAIGKFYIVTLEIDDYNVAESERIVRNIIHSSGDSIILLDNDPRELYDV